MELNRRQFRQEVLPLGPAGYEEDYGPPSVSSFMRDAQWHGTTRGADWHQRVREAKKETHVGTAQAAVDRMKYDPEASFFPVLPDNVSSIEPIGDPAANESEHQFREEMFRPQASPRPLSSEVRTGVNELQKGNALPYKNIVEDRGSTSYVIPRGKFSTLDETKDFDALPESSRRAFVTGQELGRQGVEPRAPAPSEQMFWENRYYNPKKTDSDRFPWISHEPGKFL